MRNHTTKHAHLLAYLTVTAAWVVDFEWVVMMEVVGVEPSSAVRSTKVADIAAPAPVAPPVLSPASVAV